MISYAIFLRRDVVERVGAFDERLGLGSGSLWSSGEEIDYVVRAVRVGARVEYDPQLVVHHPVKRYSPRSDGRSGGATARASAGSSTATGTAPGRRARMLVRPLGGVGVALARRDLARARFHAATLRGRVRGYLGYSA